MTVVMENKYCKSILFFMFIQLSLWGQYVNPNYGGAQSSGFGEVGAQLAGPQGGVLNPATLFLNRARIGFSLNTGVFSDYLLYFPTVKDLSFSLPVYKNEFALRFYYGIQQDNDLRNYNNYNFLGSYSSIYKGGKRRIGISSVYRLPLNTFINKWNYFDLRLGLDISRFWGNLLHTDSKTESNNYWVSPTSSGAGFSFKTGSLLIFRYTAKYQWLFSSVFQGTVFGWSRKEFDFYNLGVGLKYFLGDASQKNIQFGFEIENITELSTRKVGAGIRYNFTERDQNSVQGGVFISSKNSYNPDYRNRFLAWYTLGFTKTVYNWIMAFSLSDALNLNLSSLNPPSKDIAKVISLSLSIPFPPRKFTKVIPVVVSDPEFFDLSLQKRRLMIGKEDTLSLFLQYFGQEELPNPKIFFNIEPKVGIVLQEPYVELPTLTHLDFKEIRIPVRAIPGVPANNYSITSSLTYGNDNYIMKRIELETTEPALDVSANINNHSRYWLFETPGSYILELNIENYGTSNSDSLEVTLPESFVERGLLRKNVYVVKNIRPKSKRRLRIEFKTLNENLPPKMPISITFKESNGFDPLPIHADFVIINKSLVSFSEIKKDPFNERFRQFEDFYILITPDWNAIKRIAENTTFDLREDPNFPGKIVVGPFTDLERVLSLRYTLDNIYNNYELVALKNHKSIPLMRYFFMIGNSQETLHTLNNFPILSYFTDRTQPRKILIGPFQNMKTMMELEEFIATFFKDYQVVSRYPNQVEIPQTSKNGLSTLERDGLNNE